MCMITKYNFFHFYIFLARKICLDLPRLPFSVSYNSSYIFELKLLSIRRLLATPHSDNLLQINDDDLFKINKEKFNMKAYNYVAKRDSKIVASDKKNNGCVNEGTSACLQYDLCHSNLTSVGIKSVLFSLRIILSFILFSVKIFIYEYEDSNKDFYIAIVVFLQLHYIIV